MAMRRRLVAGNWKMHGSVRTVRQLLDELKPLLRSADEAGVEMAAIPPYVYLALVGASLSDSQIALGAQDVSVYGGQGAYTGEVSAAMLADIGCRYVVVGHSERRALFGDTDSVVAKKAGQVVEQGLRPIVCVGETLQEREAGDTLAVVDRQLSVVLDSLEVIPGRLVVAYEPVWAIGTGKTATPEQAQQVHAHLRGRLAERDAELAEKTRLLYGGSVKANNAGELFAQPDIDGGLVGGASLDASEFAAICKVMT